MIIIIFDLLKILKFAIIKIGINIDKCGLTKKIIMKKIFPYTLILGALISILYSCNPNDNNSTSSDPRDNYTGNWNCSEVSHLNGSSAFTVTISLNPNNSSQIYLANFYHLGTNQKVYGIVANTNVTIPQQTVNSIKISGSGTLTNNNTKINWNYYANDGADIDTCTAVYSK